MSASAEIRYKHGSDDLRIACRSPVNWTHYEPTMIASFRSKALKRFWTRGDTSGLRPDWIKKIDRQLTLLDVAERPEDMNVVTYGFHALSGDMAGRYAITVSRNWRLTFGFRDGSAIEVDLEDYHGA